MLNEYKCAKSYPSRKNNNFSSCQKFEDCLFLPKLSQWQTLFSYQIIKISRLISFEGWTSVEMSTVVKPWREANENIFKFVFLVSVLMNAVVPKLLSDLPLALSLLSLQKVFDLIVVTSRGILIKLFLSHQKRLWPIHVCKKTEKFDNSSHLILSFIHSKLTPVASDQPDSMSFFQPRVPAWNLSTFLRPFPSGWT